MLIIGGTKKEEIHENSYFLRKFSESLKLYNIMSTAKKKISVLRFFWKEDRTFQMSVVGLSGKRIPQAKRIVS
jgi:hypothetical protein